MTSADVVNALKYASLPTTYIGTSFTNVSIITASDKYTVVITLKRPDASWLPTLGTVGVIFEKKFQQKYGAEIRPWRSPSGLARSMPPFNNIDPDTGRTGDTRTQSPGHRPARLAAELPLQPGKGQSRAGPVALPARFTTTAWTLQLGTYTPETEVVAAQLAKIGITVNLKEMSLAAWVARYEGPKNTGFWVITNAAGGNPDPAQDAQDVVAATMRRQQAVTIRLYGQVLKIVGNDVPYVMLYTHTDDLAQSPKFTWPAYNYWGYTYPWISGIRPSS